MTGGGDLPTTTRMVFSLNLATKGDGATVPSLPPPYYRRRDNCVSIPTKQTMIEAMMVVGRMRKGEWSVFLLFLPLRHYW